MRCAWNQLLSVIPPRLREEVDSLGKETLQELRLRIGSPPQLRLHGKLIDLKGNVTEAELNHCINSASHYSPWAAAGAARGFITASGGHRIGLCGEAVQKNGQVTGIKNIRSLCIRVARDYPGISMGAPLTGSVLVLGAPGWGKTTLLRDMIRSRSDTGIQTAVIDERGELFPEGAFPSGHCTDILTGCSKAEGIHMLLRTMGPMCIAVDEITQPEDTAALLQAAGCGVNLMATAHASDISECKKRRLYRDLLESGIFDHVILLCQDKQWHLERVCL